LLTGGGIILDALGLVHVPGPGSSPGLVFGAGPGLFLFLVEVMGGISNIFQNGGRPKIKF